jgi:hypothetical protein
LETPVAFLLDGATFVLPSKVANRSHSTFQGPHPLWLRLMALGLNLGLWVLIILGVRRLIG